MVGDCLQASLDVLSHEVFYSSAHVQALDKINECHLKSRVTKDWKLRVNTLLAQLYPISLEILNETFQTAGNSLVVQMFVNL